jgi:hypothetical protein
MKGSPSSTSFERRTRNQFEVTELRIQHPEDDALAASHQDALKEHNELCLTLGKLSKRS